MSDPTATPDTIDMPYNPGPVPPGTKCAKDDCANQMWPKDAPGLPRHCPEHNELNP